MSCSWVSKYHFLVLVSLTIHPPWFMSQITLGKAYAPPQAHPCPIRGVPFVFRLLVWGNSISFFSLLVVELAFCAPWSHHGMFYSAATVNIGCNDLFLHRAFKSVVGMEIMLVLAKCCCKQCIISSIHCLIMCFSSGLAVSVAMLQAFIGLNCSLCYCVLHCICVDLMRCVLLSSAVSGQVCVHTLKCKSCNF